LISCAGNSFLPNPQTLGAGVNCRSDLKARLFAVQQHSIYEEALTGSIFTDNADCSYFLLLG
jgi:hypothetical protein